MCEVKKSKLYDTGKVFAIILVVLAHSTVMYTANGAFHPANSSPGLALLTDIIYRFHMPLFMLIAGAVYAYGLKAGKYQENIPFFKNKILRLLLPYFFWGFFYVAPIVLLLGLDQRDYLTYCRDRILFSYNPRHLWYILALFWIYVFMVLIKRIYGNLMWKIIVVSVALFWLYPMGYLPFQLSAAMQYQLYFVIGMLFEEYAGKIRLNQLKSVSVIAWSAMICVVFALYVPDEYLTQVIWALVGCSCMLAFAFACNTWFPRMLESKLYQVIKRDIFGIYLIHPMIIYVIYSQLGQKNIPPVILGFGAAVVAFVLSVFGTECIRFLRLSVLIGEKRNT